MKKVLLSLLCLFGISAMAYADTASFGVGEIKGGTGSSTDPKPFVCTKAPISISVNSTNNNAKAGLGDYSYIRLYGTSTVAISCTSGYKIDKVELSVEKASSYNAFSKASNYTLTGCTLSNSGTAYTLTPTTGNEQYIEFKVTDQLRLGSNIVVTYSSTGTEPGTDPEPGEDPQPGYTLVGQGTLAVPYTVADALYLIAQGKATTSKVYVEGKISSIKSVDTGTYGNAEYNIVDEGQTETLLVYRGYYSNNAANKKFTSKDQIAVGDDVVLCGVLEDYKGTSELTNSYIVTLNGASTEPEQGGEDPQDPETPEDPEGTVTYDFTVITKKQGGDPVNLGETSTLAGKEWMITSNSTYISQATDTGAQIGSAKNKAEYATLTTDAFEGYNIVEVTVNARSTATAATISYSLGNSEVYTAGLTTSLADYTWTPAAPVQDADPLTIQMVATKGAAALIFKKISVKYLVPELPEALTDAHVTTFVNGVAKDFATISSEDLTSGTKLKVRTVPGIEIYYQIYDPAAAETSANGPARVATASEETYDLTDSSWNKHTGHVYTYTVDENLQGKQLIVVASHPNTGEQVVKGLSVGSDGTVTGIDAIIANANAQVEYFNLQGQRVANPRGGIFIRRQGTTVTKVVR